MTNNLPRGAVLEKQIANAISEIPDDQLACRAGRHKWPSDDLQHGRPLPKGLHAHRTADNCFVLEDVCSRCGASRMMDTLPGGRMDALANWRYIYPKDWLHLSRDLESTKRDLRAENLSRCAGMLFRGPQAVAQ
jgi:hypothetical protein